MKELEFPCFLLERKCAYDLSSNITLMNEIDAQRERRGYQQHVKAQGKLIDNKFSMLQVIQNKKYGW